MAGTAAASARGTRRPRAGDRHAQGRVRARRLTEDELGARAGRVYGSRTYAELAKVTAEVTADIPAELTRARPARDPWRATKIAWRIEYAILLPGIVSVILIPGGPRTSVATAVVLTVVVYLLFWILGASMFFGSRPGKRSGGPS